MFNLSASFVVSFLIAYVEKVKYISCEKCVIHADVKIFVALTRYHVCSYSTSPALFLESLFLLHVAASCLAAAYDCLDFLDIYLQFLASLNKSTKAQKAIYMLVFHDMTLAILSRCRAVTMIDMEYRRYCHIFRSASGYLTGRET